MESDDDTGGNAQEPVLDEEFQLPRHLAALVGALHGPPDLAAHHDDYLTYPHQEEPGRVATA
jgi:hypothetical protein